MKNISFALTTRQILDRTKTVTRRLKWLTLKPGDLLQGCKKCMGRKHGEPLEKLSVIRVLHVRREPLRRLLDDPAYGAREIKREGLGDDPTLSQPRNWVPWFCASHKGCTPDTLVTRIEFEYVDPL